MTLYEDLKWRGLIKDVTDPKIEEKLNNEKITFYIGTDPTADSLHLGHLSSFLISTRLAAAGHKPILLIGGATGRIGDPRPTSEREMKTIEEVEHNIKCLTKQVKELFGFEVVNNYDWSKDINFIDFLRDYGKFFNINYMLDKDIIRRRLSSGITYTEFSYMIMQALDFLHLHEEKNVSMQVAGSDQWGNITAGVDLIRKKTGDEVYAFTMPLVTDKNGKKFGKSEGNALWLDKTKTSPYEIYQYLLNSDDSKVIDYLKIFTFLSREEIENIEKINNEAPEKRIAGHTLAYEVVKFLHGKEEADNAKRITEEVFKKGGIDINMPSLDIEKKDRNIMDLLVDIELAPSKSEARRLITQGGISINREKVLDPNKMVDDNMINNGSIIVGKGKKVFIKINIK